jgi:pyridoxine/pyridoxamine 5'-phosphate oxidase
MSFGALLRPNFMSYMATTPGNVQISVAGSRRRDEIFMLQTLTERLFDDSDRADLDPFAVFEEWFALAKEAEPNDPACHGPGDCRR